MIAPQFTPAAQRALEAAAGWSSTAGPGQHELPALLMGLLAEPECRAALVLAAHGIDGAAVRGRWPALAAAGAGSSESIANTPAIRVALQAAQAWLGRTAPDEAWATEHLLLSVATADHEAAGWLIAAGIAPHELAGQIGQRYHARQAMSRDDADLPLDEQAADTFAPPPHKLTDRPTVAQRPIGVATADGRHLAWRAIDAAANRAREGLRVVEDFTRFELDDWHLTAQLKSLRHDLAGVLATWPADQLAASRETQRDVGTAISTAAELTRDDPAAVALVNLKRAEEALRSLEEYGKLFSAEAAARLEQLRYRAYTLEKALHHTQRGLARLAHARFYVLSDGAETTDAFRRRIEALIDAGVDCLQLRDKRLDDGELLARARLLRELTRDTATLFVMNDRADLARLVVADGLHLGQEDLPVHEARAIVGPQVLVGVSTHSIEQARQAVLDGADYLGVGPTFPSTTKQFDTFPGLDFLRAVAGEIRLPAFAIGGITVANLDQVLATGATRIAVSGAITSAADPRAAARALRSRL